MFESRFFMLCRPFFRLATDFHSSLWAAKQLYQITVKTECPFSSGLHCFFFFSLPASPGVLVEGCGLFVPSRTINAYLWFVFVFFSRWRSFPWCLNAPCLWNQRLLLWVSLLEAHGATGGLSVMVHCWDFFVGTLHQYPGTGCWLKGESVCTAQR